MNKQYINTNTHYPNHSVETAAFLPSPMNNNNTDLPIGILEKVTYQNEQVLFVQRKTQTPVVMAMIFLVFLVAQSIAFGVYFILQSPNMWYFFVVLFFPVLFLVFFLVYYVVGREHSVLTNFRVLSLKKFFFRKSVTIKSIPLFAITETKCPNPTTIEFWCGAQIGKIRPNVVFENLSNIDLAKIKELVEQGKAKRDKSSSMPLTMYGHSNLALLNSDYKTLADKYTPLLWANKPTVWQFVKIPTIYSIVGMVWTVAILAMLAVFTPSEWVMIVRVMVELFVFYVIAILFMLAFMKSLAGFDAISERHGVVLIRRGFSLTDTVIPWSNVYPLTSFVDLKDGSGTLVFYKKPTFFMNGPEALVREEIIFNKFAESQSGTPLGV